jgi:hypothetical protein
MDALGKEFGYENSQVCNLPKFSDSTNSEIGNINMPDCGGQLVDYYFNTAEYVFKYSTKTFAYNFELTCFDFMDTLNTLSGDFFTNIFIELC